MVEERSSVLGKVWKDLKVSVNMFRTFILLLEVMESLAFCWRTGTAGKTVLKSPTDGEVQPYCRR